MTDRLYRHICGYPLEQDSELKRCPGCGGRITPWNTNLADETMAESFASADEALRHIAAWLADRHRAVAQNLHDAIEEDLQAQGEAKGETSLREWLGQLRDHLAEKLPETKPDVDGTQTA
ncbi:MAG: hypothetical protein ACP5JG_17365 [Anaerolineae bacterium]